MQETGLSINGHASKELKKVSEEERNWTCVPEFNSTEV
jgi:hypothetical protein